MILGNFYFLTDDYFVDFPDSYLMKNKEVINGEIHDRPCYYSFINNKTQIYWMIPFSSQVKKFRDEYNKKIIRYKRCDTIVFGEVLGHEKAFLIQNMCPVIDCYIKNEYIDLIANLPVKVNGALESELIMKAKRILALQRQGHNFIFPDVLAIENTLLSLKERQTQVAATKE